MSIINELVYDRTQADVDRVYTLKNKILTGGLAALTAEEKAEYLTGMKGAYNYTDFNRLGEAITYLVEQMKKLDIHDSSIVPKVDWVMGDTPTQSQVRNLLSCLTKLRAKLSLISEIAYQKEQEAIIQRKAEQEEVDAIAAAIERGLAL